MFKRIVVANDGSKGGFKAFAMACELAKRSGATLYMISVEELPDFPASIDEVIEEKETRTTSSTTCWRRRAARRKENREIRCRSGCRSCRRLNRRRVKALKADLLVVGFMGHSALYERIIGSTADRLVRLAPCPVLVVK